MASNDSDLLELIPVKHALLYGLAACFITFLLIGMLFSSAASSDFKQDIDDADVGEEEFSAIVFFNAHLVQVEANGESWNYLTGEDAQLFNVPSLLFFAVPIAVLFLAGRRFVTKHDDRISDKNEAAKIGASLVIGYFPMVFILQSAARVTVSGGFGQSVTLSPSSGTALLLAGMLFPVVVGGLAGYYSYDE